MPLVNAKCPNCGGALQVDNGKRAAICPFCKEAYIVEDAINNYITNYNTNIEHLHADVVNISQQKDFEIRAGELVAYRGESQDVIIPNTVRKIGSKLDHGRIGAFQGCSQLRSVVIPNTVTEIGSGAFSGCSGLTTIHIPDSVTTIGSSAFAGCSSLKTIHIPEAVTVIEYDTFWGCTSLENVLIPEGVTRIEHDAFYDCKSLRTISFPSTLTAIQDGSFSHCDVLSSLTIPETVKSISDDAFYCCRGLREITIPDSTNRWFGDAFNGCENLERVTVTGTGVTNQSFRASRYKKEQEEKLKKSRMQLGVCEFCGGEFKAFSKVCKKCGKKKSY